MNEQVGVRLYLVGIRGAPALMQLAEEVVLGNRTMPAAEGISFSGPRLKAET